MSMAVTPSSRQPGDIQRLLQLIPTAAHIEKGPGIAVDRIGFFYQLSRFRRGMAR